MSQPFCTNMRSLEWRDRRSSGVGELAAMEEEFSG